MTSTKTTQQLRIELATAEATEKAQQAAQQQRITEGQDAWSRDLHAHAKQMDEALEQQGKAHMTAAEAAAQDGDLSTAYAEFTAWLSTRTTRAQVRSQALGAANRLGLEPWTRADLSMISYPFTEWLNTQAEKHAGNKGMDAADELTGTMPTTLEELDN